MRHSKWLERRAKQELQIKINSSSPLFPPPKNLTYCSPYKLCFCWLLLTHVACLYSSWKLNFLWDFKQRKKCYVCMHKQLILLGDWGVSSLNDKLKTILTLCLLSFSKLCYLTKLLGLEWSVWACPVWTQLTKRNKMEQNYPSLVNLDYIERSCQIFSL